MRYKKTIILPVDIKSREMDARLLHAAFALQAGWRVIVGSKTLINRAMWRMPRGVYLFSTFGHGRLLMARALKRMGFASQGWDEEGLVYGDGGQYRRQRLSAETMALVDQVFAWGEASATDMRPVAEQAGKRVEVAGNPRLDLLHPKLRALHEPQAQALRQQHGRFILIPTNLSWANPHVIPPEQQPLHADTPPPGREGEFSYLQYQKRMLERMRALIPTLARAFPDMKIILRPHPVENMQAWQQWIKGLPNVEVIREGPIIAWTLASETLIHSNSTTGLEACLLGKQPIAFTPFESPRHESPLPNGVSIRASSIEDVVQVVEAIRSGSAGMDEERQKLLHWHLHITDELCTPHFIRRAEELLPLPRKSTAATLPTRTFLLLRHARKALRRSHARDIHRRNIFPDTSLEEVAKRLHQIALTTETLLPDDLHIGEIAPNIFDIYLE